MKKHISILMLSLAFWVSNLSANANNIQVSNPSFVGTDATSDFTIAKFDLTWENSWRVSTGPVQVGIFAANASEISRVSFGGSYWDIMWLSDNWMDFALTVGNTKELAFTGLYGYEIFSTEGHSKANRSK